MILVVDANVVVSALLGSRRVARVFAHSAHVLYAPAILWDEVARHRAVISSRAQITAAEFDLALLKLKSLIAVVSSYDSFLLQARSALGKAMVDEHCLACALAVGADAVWTNDTDFSSQKLVRVVSTRDLI